MTASDAQIRAHHRNNAQREHLAAWHAGQGALIRQNRPAAVWSACTGMASDLAKRGPVKLTQDQIRTCQQRALSTERLRRHKALPRSADAWWGQIEAIAAEWGITTTREEWQAETRERKEAA